MLTDNLYTSNCTVMYVYIELLLLKILGRVSKIIENKRLIVEHCGNKILPAFVSYL